MTGNEMVKAIRKANGYKIEVPMLMSGDVVHVIAEKQDLINVFADMGDNDCGMEYQLIPTAKLMRIDIAN